MRLLLHNPGSDLLDRPREVRLLSPEGFPRSMRLSARRGAGRRILGRIEGVDGPEAAAALVGWTVVIGRDALPAPEPESWYLHDVLGRPVHTVTGRDLGRLVAVHQGGPVDVWEMTGSNGTTWLPLLAGRVLAVADDGIVVSGEGIVAG
ncbi:MAG: hypothetical protein JXB39_03215 [Deltaproteobacteria bacterium]|nr:hypothetical protein [Deltaproteobacteria bacterium]